jgi:hypothetical protein
VSATHADGSLNMTNSGRRGVLLAVLAMTCHAAGAAAATPAAADTTRGFVRQESARGPLLLGPVTAADILAAFPAWPEELDGWQPDTTTVAVLQAVAEPTDVQVVLGTWCGDSRREVPRFWRLLEVVANPVLRLEMVAVGRADDEAANQVLAELGLGADFRAELGIDKVPTFIFRRQGGEIGRIVETPVVSLEGDTAAILAGEVVAPRQEHPFGRVP